MRKLLNTIQNNGMPIGAVAGVMSIFMLIMAAFMRSHSAQINAMAAFGALAIAALVACTVAACKQGKDWCNKHNIKSLSWTMV